MAAAARAQGARAIVAGARVRDVCEGVEAEIRRRGGGIAFPVQSSRNEVAAHYCPAPDDDTVYADGDLAKLDIGVEVDGWVVDTATTVNVGDRPDNRLLVEAAEAALRAAVAAVRPGVEVTRVSAAIEATIVSFGLRAMRNLCGHGVGRWTVHCAPPIPNVPDGSTDRLAQDAVVAIEPFATRGAGVVSEQGRSEVFRYGGRDATSAGVDAAIVEAIRAFNGLPFARRQLARFDRAAVDAALEVLVARQIVAQYPPLVERSGRPVAQAEHTIYVGADGVEVLTR